jgi:transcription elongation factor Elf1
MPSSQITFKCPKCGSRDLKVAGKPKANDMVTCGGCGTNTRYAVIQAAALKAGKDAAAKVLREAFKMPRF